MPLTPQIKSPNVAPAKNSRAASLAVEAVANRLAVLEAKILAPAGRQVIPAFNNLGDATQKGLPISIVVQGGAGGGQGPPGPPGGSGADPSLTYATILDESGELPNARRLVAGTNITFTDAGAGLTLTINALAAGLSFNVTNTAVTPYAVTATDVAIGGSASAGADQIINLPAATGSGRVLVFSKRDANAFNIVITANGGDLINAAGTATITVQYDTIRLYDNTAGVWATW